MRRLAIGFLLTVVIMCLACDDIAIGENPITVVGDVVYVFARTNDEVSVEYGNSIFVDYDVYLWREIEEGAVVRFEQSLYGMSRVVITVDNGNVYTIPVIECQAGDDCFISIEFQLNWLTLSGLVKGTE